MKLRPLRALAAALLLPLAACSGEPSESEMRSLVEGHMKRHLTSAGRGGFTAFEAFRKQGCVRAKIADRAYDCYYQATVPAAPGGGRAVTVNGKGRFTPGSSGMAFQDMGAQPR